MAKLTIPRSKSKPSSKARDTGNLASGIWSNPNDVDLSSPLVYRIEIYDEGGVLYDYIGKAINISRLKEYERNMQKIREGRERGKTQGYRTVHFALYQALERGWKISCYPVENSSPEELNTSEGQLIAQYPCNLNDGRSWRVTDMQGITLKSLLRR